MDDTLAESDETFTLALATPTNALLGTTASTTITISANDGGSSAVKYHAYLPLVVR